MSLNYNLATFTASYATVEQLPPSTRPEISFVGRSNVGKSSIMNKIFARRSLVKVSSRPGSTTAVNFFNVGNVDFVDLPGYGFARVAPTEKERWRDLIEGYFAQDRRFALCVALVDIRHDASDLDKQMIQYLIDREIPFMIAFTKADKLTRAQAQRQVAALCAQLSAAGDVCVVACSAEKGTGVDNLRSLINDAVNQA